MSRWFRHYIGMMRDEKLVRVAAKTGQPVERVIWVWGAALESAAELNDGGAYDLDPDEAAYFLRCDVTDVGSILSGLEACGRLTQGVVAKWSERQFESDTSRERQRRYRERKANDHNKRDDHNHNSDAAQPSRDGEVTPQENREQITDTPSLRSGESARKARPKRACQIPDNFQPDLEWAVSEGLSQERAEREAVKFRDWAVSNGSAKKDWPATWRNWVRKALEIVPRGQSPPRFESDYARQGREYQDALAQLEQKYGTTQ